jgi:hypothetical protein
MVCCAIIAAIIGAVLHVVRLLKPTHVRQNPLTWRPDNSQGADQHEL